MGEVILPLKVLDLLHQLLLGMLNMDLVDTFAILHPRCTPFARRPTIAL